MKRALLITLVLAMLLLAGCSKDVPTTNTTTNGTAMNTTATNETITNQTVPEEEPVVPQPPEEEQAPPEKTEELKVKLPGTLDLLINSIDVKRTTYAKTEQHEITMILTTAQYEKLQGAELTFTPACQEDVRLYVTLNDELQYQDTPTCDKPITLPLQLQKGPNVIAFKNKVHDSYEMTGTQVTLTYKDGTQEEMPAADFLFEPDNDAELKTVKDLGIVSMTNQVERVFRLTEEERQYDMYLELGANRKEGDLIITLNGHAIYEGKVKSTTQKLLLPAEYLKTGENTLLFYGKE